MNGLLWMFAVVLAVVFLVVGFLRVFHYELTRNRFAWVKDLPRPLTTTIGIIEIIGAVGLLLPALTHIYPWLVAAAAIGLAILMLSATTFHFFRRESDEMAMTLLLFIFAAFVAYGRLALVPLS